MTRPHRKHIDGAFFGRDATDEEIACDMALKEFDTLARRMEDKWGVERLEKLVSPDLAKRWAAQMVDLNAAINSDDPAQVKLQADAACRGLNVLDAQAEDRDHIPDPKVWEYDFDGFRFAIIQDGEDLRAAKAMRPDMVIFCMREAAQALQRLGATGVTSIKDKFPGAEVVEIRNTRPPADLANGGDEIEF